MGISRCWTPPARLNHVPACDAQVWLSVGQLANNCVWLGTGRHHAVASLAEGGVVGWGNPAKDCCLGPVQHVIDEDPDAYKTPTVA